MCLSRNVVVVLPFVPVTAASFNLRAGMPVKRCGEISERAARVLDHQTGGARMFLLPFRHDHRCAFFDGLIDELVAIAFLTAQCHEHAIPLHTPRVIRDAFHRAIKWPDDLARGNRGEREF